MQALRRDVGNGASDTLTSQMGPSTQVAQVVEQVRQVASSNFTVLITGETGTGKELVAQAIHQLSDRCPWTYGSLRRPMTICRIA